MDNILKGDHKVPLEEQDGDDDQVTLCTKECVELIKVGMKVKSKEEAYDLYNRYALRKGFSIRKGNKRRTLSEPIRQRDYLCSKSGKRDFENLGEAKRYDRLETRTGCTAKIRFTVKKGVWVVTHFDDQHNHEFATPEESVNLRSGRKILSVHAGAIRSMVGAGIKPIQSYSFLSKEIESLNIGFTKKDYYNFLHAESSKVIEAGDTQSLIDFFKSKQVEDPMFFYSVQLDDNNQLANFFWRDGRSKLDYEYFGDVVVFDTTYRTNKYNLVCAPFVGINHHWRSVLFGCAFLSNESIRSFCWLFDTFLESMDQRQPKSIFTDQDIAIMSAVEVFKESRHRLCMWHISNNAKQHLAGHFGDPDFREYFNKCFYWCETIEEFEMNWAAMIKKFELDNHSWLNRLYELREKWRPAFSRNI